MIPPKICIPVMGKTLDEMLKNIAKLQKISNCIEVRADSIDGLKEDDIVTIRKSVTCEAIFTCRHIKEGGYFKVPEDIRLSIFQKAIDLEFDYIDIELETCKTKNFKSTPSTKKIISYHNFAETPPYFDLTKVVDDIHSFHPDIIKIATMVNTDKDTISLIRLLVNKLPNDVMIVLGMGDKGKITRVLQPYLGSYLTYAASDVGSSAPGQIHFHDLKELYKNINSLI